MESVSVSLRLQADVQTRYSAEAQDRGLALGTYLRLRLEERDQLATEVTSLRRVIEQAAFVSSSSTAPSPPVPLGALTEAVLLLRFLAGPQKAGIVQKEVERRGLETVD